MKASNQTKNVSVDKPRFPLGMCFHSTAYEMAHNEIFHVENAYVCHGIGMSRGCGPREVMGHAWIEIKGFAYDTTWGDRIPAKNYREDLMIDYVVRYPRAEYIEKVLLTGYIGPWEQKIRDVCNTIQKEYKSPDN